MESHLLVQAPVPAGPTSPGPALHGAQFRDLFCLACTEQPSSLFSHAAVSPPFTGKAEKPAANCVGLKITTSLRSLLLRTFVSLLYLGGQRPPVGRAQVRMWGGGIIAISPGESPC